MLSNFPPSRYGVPQQRHKDWNLDLMKRELRTDGAAVVLNQGRHATPRRGWPASSDGTVAVMRGPPGTLGGKSASVSAQRAQQNHSD